jgi:hypothetical protein
MELMLLKMRIKLLITRMLAENHVLTEKK